MFPSEHLSTSSSFTGQSTPSPTKAHQIKIRNIHDERGRGSLEFNNMSQKRQSIDDLRRSLEGGHQFSQALTGWVRYKVLKEIGSGSFGTVFLAIDQEPGSPYYKDFVAVKAVPLVPLSPTEASLALEEVALLRTIGSSVGGKPSHPNILQFVDNFIDDESQLCTVTEYVNGGDLSALIRKHRRTWAGDYGLRGSTKTHVELRINSRTSRLPKATRAKGSVADEQDDDDNGFAHKTSNDGVWGDSKPLAAGAGTSTTLMSTAASISDSQSLDLHKEDYSQRDGYIDSFIVTDIARQLLDGLAFIHSHSIVHRDIKPGNVFISADGVVKIGDFGVSKMLADSDPFATTFIGTPHYVCPELCLGERYSFSSDVWSLGVLLYELFTLQLPFEAGNVLALMDVVSNGEYDAELLSNRKYSDAQRDRLYQQMGEVYLSQSEGVTMLVHSLISSMLVVDAHERPTAMQLKQTFFGLDDEINEFGNQSTSSSRPVSSAGPRPHSAGVAPLISGTDSLPNLSEEPAISSSVLAKREDSLFEARSSLFNCLKSTGMLANIPSKSNPSGGRFQKSPSASSVPAGSGDVTLGQTMLRSVGVRNSFQFLVAEPLHPPPSPTEFNKPAGLESDSPPAVDPNGAAATAVGMATSQRDRERDNMTQMIKNMERTLQALGGDVALCGAHTDDDDCVLVGTQMSTITGSAAHPPQRFRDGGLMRGQLSLRSTLNAEFTNTLRRYIRGDGSLASHRDPSHGTTPVSTALVADKGSDTTTSDPDSSAVYEATLRKLSVPANNNSINDVESTSPVPVGSATRVVDTLRSLRAQELQDAISAKKATREAEEEAERNKQDDVDQEHSAPKRRVSWTNEPAAVDESVVEARPDAVEFIPKDDEIKSWTEEEEAQLQDHVEQFAPWGNRHGHVRSVPDDTASFVASCVRSDSGGDFDLPTPLRGRSSHASSAAASSSPTRTPVKSATPQNAPQPAAPYMSNAVALANMKLHDIEDHIILFHKNEKQSQTHYAAKTPPSSESGPHQHFQRHVTQPTLSSIVALRGRSAISASQDRRGSSTSQSSPRQPSSTVSSHTPDHFQRQLASHIRESFALRAANEDLRRRESLDRPATAGLRGLGYVLGASPSHPQGRLIDQGQQLPRPSTSSGIAHEPQRPDDHVGRHHTMDGRLGPQINRCHTPESTRGSNPAPRAHPNNNAWTAQSTRQPMPVDASAAHPPVQRQLLHGDGDHTHPKVDSLSLEGAADKGCAADNAPKSKGMGVSNMDPSALFNDPVSLEQRLREKAIEYHRRRLMADAKRRQAIAEANRRFMFTMSANPAMSANSLTNQEHVEAGLSKPQSLFQSEASRIRSTAAAMGATGGTAVVVGGDMSATLSIIRNPLSQTRSMNLASATLTFTNNDDAMFAETCKRAFAESGGGSATGTFRGGSGTYGVGYTNINNNTIGTLNEDTLGFLQTYTKVLGEARAIGSTYVHKKQEADQELLDAKKRRDARLQIGSTTNTQNGPEKTGDVKSVVDRLAAEIEDEIDDPKLYLTMVCTVSKRSFRIKGLRSSSDTSKLLHKISKALVAEDPDLYSKVQQAQKKLAKADKQQPPHSASKKKESQRKRRDDSYDEETSDDDEKEGGINEKKCFDIPSLLALEMRFLDNDGDTVAVGSEVEWEYAIKNHVDSGRGEHAGMVVTCRL